jgi:hypothetical protein
MRAAAGALGVMPMPPPAAPPRLRIGAVQDAAEHEADAVAARVLSGGSASVRWETSAGMLRRRGDGAAASPGAEAAVNAVMGEPGVALPAREAAYFGPRMGQDFSTVRLHTGPAADKAARSVGARAFAHGRHIVFAHGAYRPTALGGLHLLAHELAHVAQGGGVLRRFTRGEERDIATLDEVVAQARTRAATSADIPYMMSWGRFTAANGGRAAQEVVAGVAGQVRAVRPGSGAGASARGSGGNTRRYLFTCLCGLIDMRHFYQLMYIGLIKGNRAAVAEGREHELNAEATSRFAAEDTPSNALGAYFGSQQSVVQRQSVFIANLRAHLARCHPIDYRALPADQKQMILDWYAVDGSSAPAHQNEHAFPNMDRIPACAGLGMFPFVLARDNEGYTNRLVGTVSE